MVLSLKQYTYWVLQMVWQMLCHEIKLIIYFSNFKVSHFQTVAMPHNLRQTSLGLAKLDIVVHQLTQYGITISTRKEYASGQKLFLEFCQHFALKPFPASEALFSRFVAFVAESGISYGSVYSYLAPV